MDCSRRSPFVSPWVSLSTLLSASWTPVGLLGACLGTNLPCFSSPWVNLNAPWGPLEFIQSAHAHSAGPGFKSIPVKSKCILFVNLYRYLRYAFHLCFLWAVVGCDFDLFVGICATSSGFSTSRSHAVWTQGNKSLETLVLRRGLWCTQTFKHH